MANDLIRELRQGWRRLRRAPAFTCTALLVLGLALGATITMFGILNAVLVRPLPYPDSDRLVNVSHGIVVPGITSVDQSDATFMLYEAHNAVFDGMAIYHDEDVNLGSLSQTSADAERVSASTVSDRYFQVLRVGPLRGRAFVPGEDRVNAPKRVVIVSEGLWRRKFSGDAAVLGKQVMVDGVLREIVGIMPGSFRDLTPAAELWIPMSLDPAHTSPGSFNYKAVARLKPGVSIAAATADLTRVLPRLLDDYPSDIPRAMFEKVRLRPILLPLRDIVVGNAGRLLWTVFGTAVLLLLIAVANVAGLFLVRAEARQRELAIRSALGAGRAALLAHYLSESLLLAVVGGMLGLCIAAFAVGLLSTLPAGIDLPRLREVGIDGSVFLFAAILAGLSALVVSLVPLRRTRTVAIAMVLQDAGRSATTGARRHRARSTLVIAQVALALVLLSAAGLMARSFARLRSVQPGFSSDSVLVLRVALPPARYSTPASMLQFYDRLRTAASIVPGVRMAAITSWVPLTGDEMNFSVGVDDRPTSPNTPPSVHSVVNASSEYLLAMGIPVIAGRAIQGGSEEAEHPLTEAVVSRSFAHRYWGDSSALGRRIRPGIAGRWYTVVGVAGDVHLKSLDAPAEQAVYLPLGFESAGHVMVPPNVALVVGTAGDASSVLPALRRVVRDLDPSLPIYGEQPLSRVVQSASARARFLMSLIGVASVIALALGAVGLYGVMAYGVSLRQREIGVRMALGAGPAHIRQMISRQGLALAATGIVIGLAGALAVTRLLRGLLYDVSPTDPVTLTATCVVLLVVALLATWVPAHRAATVDPADALRND